MAILAIGVFVIVTIIKTTSEFRNVSVTVTLTVTVTVDVVEVGVVDTRPGANTER